MSYRINRKIRDKTIAFFLVTCLALGATEMPYAVIADAATVQISKTAIKSVKVVSYHELKITWKQITGASGYIIYRSVKKNTAFSKLKAVTASKVSITDASVKTGVTYYYKIKVFKKSGSSVAYSGYSARKSGKAYLGKPTLKISTSDSAIQLTAAKTAGINGYKIYRAAAKNGTYKLLATKSVTGKLDYTDSSTAENTQYYYKIRTYRIVDGKKVYSAYSSVKSAEIVATDNGSTDNGSTDNGSTDSGSTDSGSTDSGSATSYGTEGTDYYLVAPSSDSSGLYVTEGASGIAVDSDNKVITISASGSYMFSGDLSGYQIYMATKNLTVNLLLNGVTLSNASSASIFNSKGSTAVNITLCDGTNNTVTGASIYPTVSDEIYPDAAIYTDGNLTFDGTGTLNLSDSSTNGDGIKSKKVLTIDDGTYILNTADDGMSGKTATNINGGDITITSGGDGIKTTDSAGVMTVSGGSLDITAGSDGLQSDYSLYVTGGSISAVTTGDGIVAASLVSVSGGTLNLTAGDDGIQSDVDVDISNGDSTINSVDKGIVAASVTTDDSGTVTSSTGTLKISGGTMDITSTDDAIHSNKDISITGGELNLSAGDDGIHADEINAIGGGTISITKSYEGIEGGDIQISDGTISLVSSDDGINGAGGTDTASTSTASGDSTRPGFNGGQGESSSTGTAEISGGDITVNASGDGIDVNGNLTMSAGNVIVYGPTASDNAALDYDGTFTITGGTLIAMGSSGMAQAPGSTSTQYSVQVTMSSSKAANSTFTLKDSSGNTILSATSPKAYNSVVVSSPSLLKGSTYSAYVGTTKIGSALISTYLTKISG